MRKRVRVERSSPENWAASKIVLSICGEWVPLRRVRASNLIGPRLEHGVNVDGLGVWKLKGNIPWRKIYVVNPRIMACLHNKGHSCEETIRP